ncbi:MAG: glycosyltransferase family 4 protein [Bryobacteraceae bacterium]
MRLVFLNPVGVVGGAESSLLDVLSGLRKSHPEWEIHLATGSNGPLVDRAKAVGVRTTVLPLPPAVLKLGDSDGRSGLDKTMSMTGALLPAARYLSKMKAHLRGVRPDLIHTNGFKMHVLGAWAAPPMSPVVWHIRDYVSPRPVMAKLLHFSAGHCAMAIANSESVAADVRRVCGPGLPVKAVLNAIDVRRFTPAGAGLDLDRMAGLPKAPPRTVRVGLVATFARWKGHETFLRAISMLPRQSMVRGYVIGGPVYDTMGSQYTMEELKEMAEKLGVEDRVGFTGFVDDPSAAMRSLDVVVHASTNPEPFGLVIVQGMATGRAVIASRGGGPEEICDPGVNALMHLPGDAAELALCITTLEANPDLRARMGVAGRATAETRFDRNRLAGQLVKVYREVTSAMQGSGALCAEFSER